MTVVGPVGSWPPSVNVAPPSSEYMNPDSDTGDLVGSNENARKSLKPITICRPVLSTAIEVSDCVPDGASSGASQSPGAFTQPPDCAPMSPDSAAIRCCANEPPEDSREPGLLDDGPAEISSEADRKAISVRM